MDWMTFISKMTEALAWPAVVAWIFWTYRERLAELIPLMKQLKAGPFEANFDLEKRTAKALAEATASAPALLFRKTSPVSFKAPKPTSLHVPTAMILKRAAERNAALNSFMSSWGDIDRQVYHFAIQTNLIGHDPLINTAKVFKIVMESGKLPESLQKTLSGLRNLYEVVAQGHATPTEEARKNFAEATAVAAASLLEYRRTLPNFSEENDSPEPRSPI
jgi:hypothetical protein